jgi:hypothetical protein
MIIGPRPGLTNHHILGASRPIDPGLTRSAACLIKQAAR